MDAGVDAVGAGGRQRLCGGPDRDALPRRADRGRAAALRAGGPAVGGAGPRGRGGACRWLRRVGAPGPGAAALRPVGQRRGPAPAAAHLLERDGRAGGTRVRPLRGAGRQPAASALAAGGRRRGHGAARTRPVSVVLPGGAVCLRGRAHRAHRGRAQLGSAAGLRAGGRGGGGGVHSRRSGAKRHRAGRPAGNPRTRGGDRARGARGRDAGRRRRAEDPGRARRRRAVAPASSRAAHRDAPHLRRAGRRDRRRRQGDERAAGAVGRGDAPRLAAEQPLRLLGCCAAGLRRLAAARRRRRWLARRLAALAEGQRVRPGRSLARAADPGRARRGRGGPAAGLLRRSRGGGPAGARCRPGGGRPGRGAGGLRQSTARWIGIGRCRR